MVGDPGLEADLDQIPSKRSNPILLFVPGWHGVAHRSRSISYLSFLLRLSMPSGVDMAKGCPLGVISVLSSILEILAWDLVGTCQYLCTSYQIIRSDWHWRCFLTLQARPLKVTYPSPVLRQ